MKEFEYKKINEEDLDIKVSIRRDGFPYSYSSDQIRVCNIHLTHRPTGLSCNVDSNTGIDTGYKYALKELEKKYAKLIAKRSLKIYSNRRKQ